MARKQGVVAYDIDGVLADFTSGFTQRAFVLGIVPHPWDGYSQRTWSFKFHVDPVWASVDQDPRFWSDLDPLVTKKEVEMMNEMAESRQVIYATHRRGAEKQTMLWLERYGFPEGPVFFDCDKRALYTSLGSQLIAAIDDRPETCALADQGIPMVTRDWPYNRGTLHKRVVTVDQFIRSCE